MTNATRPIRRPPYQASVIELDSAHCPSVSVIVPCYNYAHWLAGCVNSVLQQEHVNVDVLVVNDGSSDNSAEVAHQLAAGDSRVKVIDHKQNRGHIPSVNDALQHVRGEYVVKIDADDLLVEGSLARSVALLEAHPGVGFVYGRALYFGQDLQRLPALHRLFRHRMLRITDEPQTSKRETRTSGWTVWPGPVWVMLLCRRGANCISQPEVVIRASALRAIGGYDPALPHTSDLAMWLRLASIADVGHVDSAIQGLYRVHSRSMQRTVHAGALQDLRGRLAAFESVLCDPANPLPHARKLTTSVRRRLASESLTSAFRAFDRGRANVEPVEDYIAFALECDDAARSLPQWTKLQQRQRIGPRYSPYFPPFLLNAVLRRASDELSAAHWWRTGI
jgi:glycosyltransferase involved in cell wall biosynthesis